MAKEGSRSTGAAVPFLKQARRPPDDLFENVISSSWNSRIKHTKTENSLLHLRVTLYVLFILLTQLWRTREQDRHTLLQATTITNTVVPMPLASWCQHTIYSHVLNDGRACSRSELRERRCSSRMVPANRTQGYCAFLCTVLLLCGDIHLNPGPWDYRDRVDSLQSAVPTVQAQLTSIQSSGVRKQGNPLTNSALKFIPEKILTSVTHAKPAAIVNTAAVLKQQHIRLFQTANHASILWNPKTKPKGIFGGHLNIRSIVSKTEQIEHLLTDSNLDYLCLTETWLTPSIPSSIMKVSGYTLYRRDRNKGKGGGVLIYVKDHIQSKQLDISDCTLECVGTTITLSPQMTLCISNLSTS